MEETKENYVFAGEVPFNEKKQDLLKKFLDYCFKVLALTEEKPVEISFAEERNEDPELVTTAYYNDGESKITIYSENRAFIDIARSLAHELVHKKQFSLDSGINMTDHKEGQWEDQANAVAGKIIRGFGAKYPDAYDEEELEEVVEALEQLTGKTVVLETVSYDKKTRKWLVKSHTGKILGTHDTEEEADTQLRAIHINQNKPHKEGLKHNIATALALATGIGGGLKAQSQSQDQNTATHQTASQTNVGSQDFYSSVLGYLHQHRDEMIQNAGAENIDVKATIQELMKFAENRRDGKVGQKLSTSGLSLLSDIANKVKESGNISNLIQVGQTVKHTS